MDPQTEAPAKPIIGSNEHHQEIERRLALLEARFPAPEALELRVKALEERIAFVARQAATVPPGLVT
jgi:hypothetical protein